MIFKFKIRGNDQYYFSHPDDETLYLWRVKVDNKITFDSFDYGPAYIGKDGRIEYAENGVLHREDGPAQIDHEGNITYSYRGVTHRDDGPAFIGINGRLEYFKFGKRHNESGPSIIDGNYKKYHLNGKEMIEEDFRKYIADREEEYDF